MKKIAIPVENDCLCSHFGHCREFVIIETENNEIKKVERHNPPPHQPGVLPSWLAQHNVTHIIAAGIGNRAIQLFNQNGIEVLVGAEAKSPEELANDLLAGKLKSGSNLCDH